METPRRLEDAAEKDSSIIVREQEYDGQSVIAVDFGPNAGHPQVDVVDDTVIVVVDDEQFEFEMPADASDVTVNDGILTIKS